MRVATLFKRLLRRDRERVVGLELTESDGREAVIVDLGLPARRALWCSGCARRVRVAYDRRIQTWRHLDLARTRLVLRCQIRRIQCPQCGIRSEQVPWARAGSRFTRAFEDTCVYLAKAAPKSAVAELMLHRLGERRSHDRARDRRAHCSAIRRRPGLPCPHRHL
jgi:transposase